LEASTVLVINGNSQVIVAILGVVGTFLTVT